MVTLLTTTASLATTQRIALVEGAMRVLYGPISIEIDRGTLWITQAGDDKDHILTKGQSWSTLRPGKVVIQAMQAAEFRHV